MDLHVGGSSAGCITVSAFVPKESVLKRIAEFMIINQVIKSTKTEKVPDNRGGQKWLPGTQIKYGTLTVINKKIN
jgi:hypothetical protein